VISGESVQITIRPVRDSDAPFLARIGPRLFPGTTASPRDPDTFRAFFDDLTPDSLASTPDDVASIAELDGEPAGVVAAHLDVDYFTKHSRLYIDTLAVADKAEGRGVGRALMAFVENRARELGCREVVLDVFAGNSRARGFYEACGYAADHIRMAKPLG
jgi:ribosomal protein S18 acetylase RimI-like enzyme